MTKLHSVQQLSMASTGTLSPAYKKVENAFIQKVVRLHNSDLRDDTSPPPSIEQEEWARIYRSLMNRVCGGTNTWDQLNTAARATVGRAACRHLVYDYLLKLTDCKQHPECKDKDVRELVLRHMSSLTRNSVGGSLYLLWPEAGAFLRDTVMKQDKWVNLKPRGGGKARKRKAQSLTENDTAVNIAAGGGVGPTDTDGSVDNARDIPNGYQCPITHEIMADPVIAGDGHTYERAAIEDWLLVRNMDTSPKTGAVLAHKELQANFTLKSLIDEYTGSVVRTGGSSSSA